MSPVMNENVTHLQANDTMHVRGAVPDHYGSYLSRGNVFIICLWEIESGGRAQKLKEENVLEQTD